MTRGADLRQATGDVRQELSDFRGEVREEFSAVKAQLVVMKWIGGFILAGVSSLLVRTVIPL